MRKWIPLTFLGLGGLGAIVFTVRKMLRTAELKQNALAWNDSAQQQLNQVQQAVTRLEESLPAR